MSAVEPVEPVSGLTRSVDVLAFLYEKGMLKFIKNLYLMQ